MFKMNQDTSVIMINDFSEKVVDRRIKEYEETGEYKFISKKDNVDEHGRVKWYAKLKRI